MQKTADKRGAVTVIELMTIILIRPQKRRLPQPASIEAATRTQATTEGYFALSYYHKERRL